MPQEVDIFADDGPGGTVIAVEEIVHRRVEVQLGIPQQFRGQIAAQLVEFAAHRARALLEENLDAVSDEILDVGLHHAEARRRHLQLLEAAAAVPYENVVGQRGPGLHVASEVGAARIVGDRHVTVALDAAEHDVDVRGGFGFGSFARVEVTQRRDRFVGETCGHFVCETDDRPGRALLFGIYFGTFGTGTVAVVVVRADRPVFRFGVRRDPPREFVADDFEHLRVRQAGLRGDPPAFDHRIVFGVLRVVFFRRQQRVERVDEKPEFRDAAVEFVVEFVPVEVERIIRHRIGVTRGDLRNLFVVERHADPQLCGVRHHDRFGGVFAAAEILFQQCVNAVECPMARTSVNREPLSVGTDHESVLAEACERVVPEAVGDSDQYLLVGRRCGVGNDRQFSPGNFEQVFLQFRCGLRFGGRCGGGFDDYIIVQYDAFRTGAEQQRCQHAD